MKRGFSLVELSIVLVILGLLTGGILAGQSLIRASELRAVATEYQRFNTAIHTFRDKYFALPGDMNAATKFWGTAAACPGTNAQPSTDPTTCNGDGDGMIEIVTNVTSGTSHEQFRAWQHLANAGLLEGTYTGVYQTAGNTQDAQIGVNVPRSKISNAGWSLFRQVNWAALYELSGAYDAMVFQFGTETGAGSTFNKALAPTEAWNIDTKMDDGRPGTGSIMSFDTSLGTTSNCATSTASATATYALTLSSIECSILFKANF